MTFNVKYRLPDRRPLVGRKTPQKWEWVKRDGKVSEFKNRKAATNYIANHDSGWAESEIVSVEK